MRSSTAFCGATAAFSRTKPPTQLDRDTRRREFDPAAPIGASGPEPPPSLDAFIRANPEVFRQAEGSPRAFMARWITLQFMERIQARERGQRVIQEFIGAQPGFERRRRAQAGRALLRNRPFFRRQ